MIINIDERTRINSDKYQYMVQYRSANKQEITKKSKGKPDVTTMEYVWTSDTSHPSVTYAINSLIKLTRRQSDVVIDINNAQSVADGLDKINEEVNERFALLDKQYKLVEDK